MFYMVFSHHSCPLGKNTICMLFSPLFAAFHHHNGNVLFQLVGVKCMVLSETTGNTCRCGGVNANLVRGVNALCDITKSKGELQK